MNELPEWPRDNSVELVDTHAHLESPRLFERMDEVLQAAQAAGVVAVIAIGTDLSTSRACCNLASRYAPVSAAVGIQPNCCHEARAGDWDEIIALQQHDQVVALGETGLDRYWDDCPFDLQQDYFDRHLRLSQATGTPFVVHMRDCQEDVLSMLREAAQRGPLRGVMHSYTGNADGAAECVGLGLHISFAGMVTYKKSDELRAVAAQVPRDRILVETDSPYLTPVPRRGKRPNHPALVQYTARCLADVRGMPFAEFGQQVRENTRALFGI